MGTVLLSVCLAKHFIEERGGRLHLYLHTWWYQNLPLLYTSYVVEIFSSALLKSRAKWVQDERGCSDAATLQSLQTICLTLTIDRQRPNTLVFAVCIPHRLVLQARSWFSSLVSQDKPLRCTYLATSRRKPQTAAYAMKFEMLRAETELVEPGSQISRGSCDTFHWGKTWEVQRIIRSSCISNFD